MSREETGGGRRTTPVVVLGVGNPDRGDDAAGILAALRVRQGRPDLTVHEHRGDALDLLARWQEVDFAVVIDAVAGGGPPGTVHRLAGDALDHLRRLRPWSSHGGDLAAALALGAALDRLPRALLVYGIAGTSFALGAPPGREVVAAAEAVGDEILRTLAPARAGSSQPASAAAPSPR